MKKWEESISVSAPADKIFAHVSDFTRHGEWAGHGLQATKIGEGPVAVGTKYVAASENVFARYSEGGKTYTAVLPIAYFDPQEGLFAGTGTAPGHGTVLLGNDYFP